MTARAALRTNETDWTRPIVAPPITRTEIANAAYRRNPALARRLAERCRASARRLHTKAADTRIESLHRVLREEAAELEAAATLLDMLT